jgi:hypothetical protein
MSDTAATDPVFTPKEIEYMAAAMMCLKDGVPTVSSYFSSSSSPSYSSTPLLHPTSYLPIDSTSQNAQIDTPAFVAMTNLTAGSALVIWNRLRRKLEAQALTRGSSMPSTPVKPKARATPKSKRKTEDGDGEGEGGATPSKKPRGKKGKAQVVKGEDEEGEEMIEEQEAGLGEEAA